MVPEGGSELFEGGAEQIVPEPVGRGLPRVRTPVRNQVAVPWLTLDELLPPDHRARSVWSFVEKLELSALYRAIKAVEGRGGPGGPLLRRPLPPRPGRSVVLHLGAPTRHLGLGQLMALRQRPPPPKRGRTSARAHPYPVLRHPLHIRQSGRQAAKLRVSRRSGISRRCPGRSRWWRVGGPGHPPGDPRLLVALWLYATPGGGGERPRAGAVVWGAPGLSPAVWRGEHEPPHALGLPGGARIGGFRPAFDVRFARVAE